MTAIIPIKAVVSDNEKAAVTLAAKRLEVSLTEAAGEPVQTQLSFAANLESLGPIAENGILITTFVSEVANVQEPWAEVENRLRAKYKALSDSGSVFIFILTVFRHVDPDLTDDSEAVRIRIRRLDRLAAELSRELGIMVIDIDRDFANLGARNLETDYRLAGQFAPAVAAKTITLSLISAGLDSYVSFEAQDAAKTQVANDNVELAIPVTTEVKPSNILAYGKGRRRQAVKTVVDTNSENHAGWLVHLLLSGQFGFGEALAKLKNSIARRGVRASAVLLIGAVRHSLSARRGS